MPLLLQGEQVFRAIEGRPDDPTYDPSDWDKEEFWLWIRAFGVGLSDPEDVTDPDVTPFHTIVTVFRPESRRRYVGLRCIAKGKTLARLVDDPKHVLLDRAETGRSGLAIYPVDEKAIELRALGVVDEDEFLERYEEDVHIIL